MTPFLILVSLVFQQAAPKPAPPSPAQRLEKIKKEAATARDANKSTEAIRLYKEGVQLKSDWLEGWWSLGTLYYDDDLYIEGRDALRRFTHLEPKVGAAWGLLGLCEYQTRDYERALVDLRKADELGLPSEGRLAEVSRYHLAILLTRFEQYEEAMAVLARFAQEGKGDPLKIEATGLAALRKPLLPIEMPPQDRQLVVETGHAAFDAAARHAAKADQEMRDLVAHYPNTPNVHYIYASYLLLTDPDAALKEFDRELELNPAHVPVLVSLSLEYLKRGQADKGVPYAKRAVDAAPDSFAVHTTYGRLLVETGKLDDGIKELETARKQAPGSPQTRIALATAYAKAGRKEDAARERQEFLKLKEQAKSSDLPQAGVP
jgi:tetratricopeptide (TPR) repeat protein